MPSYSDRVRAEIDHYRSELLQRSENGLVATPPVWNCVEAVMARRIQRVCGQQDGVAYVVHELNRRSRPRFLSLGAGSCALELEHVLPALERPAECTLECVDLNTDLMEDGRLRAAAKGWTVVATALDINQLRLEENAYDVILCWASLHHFIELDHIAAELNRALKPDGVFLTMDICSRNGFLLWPETKAAVEALWQMLPDRYRVAHTLSSEPVYCPQYPDKNCAETGFECIRSEDILPALERNLRRVHLVVAHALARRFFDTMFGPNFDLSREFDREFFREVLVRDEAGLGSGRLKPETFYGVYAKRTDEPARRPFDWTFEHVPVDLDSLIPGFPPPGA